MSITISEEQLKQVHNVYKETKSQRITAQILSEDWGRPIGKSTVGDWLRIPFNEQEGKIVEATPEECIEELRRVVEEHPDKYITGMFFQQNGRLAHQAWKHHFGTFDEFKRQAGITSSRHVSRHQLHIAKHASLDRYREMSRDRMGWGAKYEKPSGDRFQTILVGSDIHDVNCDPFWRFCFIDTAKRMQPNIIVINGDLFDLPEFGRYNVDPRKWDVVGRIQWAHEFLGDLREVCPDAQIDLIEGNHELRLVRHLAEASPVMKAVLADLHGMSVADLFALSDFEVNYVAAADLATTRELDMRKELKRNYRVYFDCYMTHHYPDARNWGLPGTSGHHHSHLVWRQFSPLLGSYEWHQTGAGHVRSAEYCNGEKWDNGFLAAHIDTHNKKVQQEYFDILDHAVIGGQWYMREEIEGK